MKSKAFTLVEILIVVAVISILTAVIIPSYYWSERRLALERSALQVAQDIRGAKEMAMSVRELSTGNVPPGYGVYFEKSPTNLLYIYADTNPSPGDEEYSTTDQTVSEIKLEKKVSIKTIYCDSAEVNSVSVNFKPPDPSIKIVGDGIEGNLAVIILCLDSDNNKTKTIKINKIGLVTIE
ncbi:MAG: type II secretion system protein [Patescibacteria group bacterium]|nr:type II secretion system protein [Patescibacteria group bacterium]